MAYGNFKDLAKRTIADKILRDKTFNIASEQKHDGYQRRIVSMVYKFFDKKPSGGRINNNKENRRLADEIHKPIIRNFFKKRYIFHLEVIFGA